MGAVGLSDSEHPIAPDASLVTLPVIVPVIAGTCPTERPTLSFDFTRTVNLNSYWMRKLYSQGSSVAAFAPAAASNCRLSSPKTSDESASRGPPRLASPLAPTPESLTWRSGQPFWSAETRTVPDSFPPPWPSATEAVTVHSYRNTP